MKTGMRFKSAVCTAEGVVVRAADGGGDLTCGGTAVTAAGQQPVEAAPLTDAQDGAALVGKRYVDADTGLEVLCTKSGFGAFAFAGRPLALKEAKALPASD